MNNPATILFFAANPKSTTPLDLAEETRAIEHKLRAAEHRDAFQLVPKLAVRPDDLLQSLLELRPTIVHFSGHGELDGELVMHGEGDKSQWVSPEAIASLFRAHRDAVRVVVFNACDSLAQAEAVAQEIDCAIGMTTRIGDEAARVFAASFYRTLGFGRSVAQAFEDGLLALRLAKIPEDDTPRLITRPGVAADQLFVLKPAGGPARVALLAHPDDEEWTKQLKKHLKPVARHAGVEVWDRSMIAKGTRTQEALAEGFSRARAVVIIVTSNLIADDDYIHQLERFAKAAASGGTRVLSVFADRCAFETYALREYEPLNDPELPLDKLDAPDRSEQLVAIAESIIACVTEA